MAGDLAEKADALDESLRTLVDEVRGNGQRLDAVSKRTNRNRVTNILLSVVLAAVVGVGGLVWWSMRSEKQEDCRSALNARAESEEMWTGILTEADAGPAALELLDDGYAGLPTPADCK